MSSSGQVVATADKANTLEDSGTDTHQRARDLLSHIKSIMGKVKGKCVRSSPASRPNTQAHLSEKSVLVPLSKGHLTPFDLDESDWSVSNVFVLYYINALQFPKSDVR